VSDERSTFEVLSISDAEAVPIDGGKLQWVPVRRRLGIGGFGTNAYRAERAGDVVIEEHVESPGQEEMYVVIAGRMRFVADDDEVEVPSGGVVFVQRPEVRRSAVALEDDTTVLAVGGWPDKPYHSLPWEPIYLAQDAMRLGDWATAAETLEREAGEHRDTAIVQLRLACCHAQLGEHELALAALRRALEINPRIRGMAEEDELLAPLRSLPGWPGDAA
jgi:quercetin dioxygenase-like cupin family protein